MIEQWKRERDECDREVAAINRAIDGIPTPRARFSHARANLKILRNKVLVARQKLHQRILHADTEAERDRIFANVSGLSDAEAQKLQRDMEGLRRIAVR